MEPSEPARPALLEQPVPPARPEGLDRPAGPRPEGAAAGRRLGARDVLALLAILALNALVLWRGYDFDLPPYEDAAILMRYAEHIAEGHGIVWNVGEEPVDGATDFLFLVTLAGVVRLGLSVERATQVLGIVPHVLTCLFVYLAVRRLHGGPRWTALLSAACLTLGPGLRYVEAYFGTPFFAMFSATTWYLAYAIFQRGATPARSVGFATSSLLLGLTRPDGVFLATFVLAGLCLCRGWSATRRVARDFVLIFGTLGTAYFLWRWSYFGYPLPNPFYVKGGGLVYPAHMVVALKEVVALTAPFLPLLVLAGVGASTVLLARSEPAAARRASLLSAASLLGLAALFVAFRGSIPTRRSLVVLVSLVLAGGGVLLLTGRALLHRFAPGLARAELAPEDVEPAKEAVWVSVTLGLFAVIWIFLSGGMDYMMRYRYAVVPIVLLSWPSLLGWLQRAWHVPPRERLDPTRRLLRLQAIGLFSLLAVGYQVVRFPPVRLHRWGTLDVARILADYDPSHRIALTNAGQLPLYSGWRTLDAWGLSDQWITHNGGITKEYLAAFDPHVIQFDAVFSPVDETSAGQQAFRTQAWYLAIEVLNEYAKEHGYVLAAAFGLTPHKTHYYYVRPDFPASEEIVARIRAVQYHIDGLPQVAIDYARLAGRAE